MVRKNGKLIPFLKEALCMNKYINLTHEPKGVFCIELPRYEGNIDPAYEAILIDWYKVNGRIKKYKNYSVGKAVFQAALYKSLYLISLSKNGKKLRFRLSVPSEIEEKRVSQKKKNAVPEVNSPSISHSDSDNNINLLENLPDFLDESFQDDDVLSPTQENTSLLDIGNSANIQLQSCQYLSLVNTVLPKFETMPEIRSIEEKHEAKEVKNVVPQFNPPSVSSSGYHSDGDDNMEFLDNWPNLEKCFQVDDVVAPIQENLTSIDSCTKTQLDSVSDCRQSIESVLPNAEDMLDIEGFESFQELMACSISELSQILGNLDLPAAENSQNVSVTGNLPAMQDIKFQQHTTAGNNEQNVWVCKKKIQIDSSLWHLVFELARPELGVVEGVPERIVMNGILEAGQTYVLIDKVPIENNGKRYLLLMLNCLG